MGLVAHMSDENMLDALAASEEPAPSEDRGPAKRDLDMSDSLGAAFLSQSESREGAILDVDIDIVAVLGTADLKVSQILQLGRGAVVELDRLIGEPVDIRAERQLIAKGEVVVVEDRLAIQLTEVIKN
jgi:flagellar motor switch protein FliN/FliY